VGLGGVLVHGNVMHTLGALDGTSATLGQGQGALQGRARADLARGIDPVGRGGSSGEVTTREEVGAALP
jgi:hypothetical protein